MEVVNYSSDYVTALRIQGSHTRKLLSTKEKSLLKQLANFQGLDSTAFEQTITTSFRFSLLLHVSQLLFVSFLLNFGSLKRQGDRYMFSQQFISFPSNKSLVFAERSITTSYTTLSHVFGQSVKKTTISKIFNLLENNNIIHIMKGNRFSFSKKVTSFTKIKLTDYGRRFLINVIGRTKNKWNDLAKKYFIQKACFKKQLKETGNVKLALQNIPNFLIVKKGHQNKNTTVKFSSIKTKLNRVNNIKNKKIFTIYESDTKKTIPDSENFNTSSQRNVFFSPSSDISTNNIPEFMPWGKRQFFTILRLDIRDYYDELVRNNVVLEPITPISIYDTRQIRPEITTVPSILRRIDQEIVEPLNVERGDDFLYVCIYFLEKQLDGKIVVWGYSGIEFLQLCDFTPQVEDKLVRNKYVSNVISGSDIRKSGDLSIFWKGLLCPWMNHETGKWDDICPWRNHETGKWGDIR